MAASSNVGSAGTSWSKWQVALLVGAPVVVGVGCWYLKTKKSNDDIGKDLIFSKNKRLGSEALNNSSSKSNEVATSPMDKDPTFVQIENLSPFEAAQAHKDKGNELFKKRLYKEASNHYTLAIHTCPRENSLDLSKFYQNRAAACEQLELYDEVWSDCSRALELNPKYVKAYHRRAKVYEIKKQLQQSLEDLTAACILEGFENQTTLISADRILKELGRQHAKESMSKNQVPKMPANYFVKTYFSSFSEDPTITTKVKEEDKEGGFSQAQTAFLTQNYHDIIKACTEEIDKIDSSYIMEAHLLKGTFHLLLGQFDAALTDFNIVINNSNKASAKLRVNALIKRASLFMQLEQLQESLNDFDQAVKIDPDNSDIYHHRGQLYLLMEKVTEAMDDFNKAVTLKPNFPIAYVQKCYTEYRYAVTNQNMDKMQDVMTAFKDAIAKFPNCSECYTLYAQVLSDQQDFEQADQNFIRAIEVEPDNATLYVHRGLLQIQWTADIPKATNMIKKAIKLDPLCLFAFETMGTIEVQQCNLAKAVEMFNTAIPIAKTELERAHLFALRDAAVAQYTVAKKMGISVAHGTS